MRVAFANQVRKLRKETLECHILSQNATDISHEPTRRIKVAHRAMVALSGDSDKDPLINSTLDSIHKPLIVDWQVAHSVASKNDGIRALEKMIECGPICEQWRHCDLCDICVHIFEDFK